ncbi:MAG: hypothetical protein RLZZ385_2330 [Pseudomonadota bacterium]|jgi:hypothetical protein
MEISWQIPRAALLWILLAVLLALAPQSLRMPVWISAIAVACLVWRGLIYLGHLDYPGKRTRVLVVLFTLLVAASQIRSLGVGLDSAASLLALGFVFKLIEMQSKRDVFVMISLCFVMSLVAFIYSQSAVTTLYVTVVVLVVVAAMVAVNRSPHLQQTRSTLGLALRITAQSVPLMVVLFLVFPRIAPLWAVPIQTSTTRTGVSDEMTPGDISQLGRSAQLAFRVTFDDGAPPLHRDLYWRGLVLEDFDGLTWRRRSSSFLSAAAARSGTQLDYPGRLEINGEANGYNIIMEATQQPWLFALHLAEPVSGNVYRGRNYELFYGGVVNQRISYNVRSYDDFTTDGVLLGSVRARSLEIPADGNPRSRELASQLRATYANDRDLVYAVLALYQQQPFFYTLTPPLLGEDRIDDFLFNTRQGFCEHYASSFTYLLRAAGIPARVVVGYHGAEYNRYEDYLMVYQYNAHAWSEVWLEGEGWVRFDPTAAVSPERIELGVEAALQDDPEFLNESLFTMARLRGIGLINSLRLRLDAIEYEWNRRVVSYDEEVQFQLFERLFGQVTERKVLMLLLGAGALVVFCVALAVIRIRPDRRHSAAEKLYLEFCRRLANAGLPRQRGEGPMDYCRRVSARRPDLAEQMGQLTELYVKLNYAPALLDESSRRRSLAGLKKSLVRVRPGRWRLTPSTGGGRQG